MRLGVLAVLAGLTAACGATPAGTYILPASAASEYDTAYIAEVVAAPDGGDLTPGAGEHVVIRSNFDLRTDLGGWTVVDADGNRLPLGIGTQLDAGAELRVHTGCGEGTAGAVFACLDAAVLDDAGDVVRLLDAGDNEVAQIAYGDAAQ